MQTRPNKTIALLLSLLLGLLPLQNLFAFDAAPMAHGVSSATMQMAAMDGHGVDAAASADCHDCDTQSCCEPGSCTLHHCASCTLSAVIPCDFLVLERVSGTAVPGLQQNLPANIHSAFFRPPRS